jgi:hypothetical protein
MGIGMATVFRFSTFVVFHCVALWKTHCLDVDGDRDRMWSRPLVLGLRAGMGGDPLMAAIAYGVGIGL